MKVLIVSFDKSLVNKLRKALEGFDVVDVKNGEEALSLASPNVDVVVYDAIAGSVSEEDINNIYRQKFKDSKFVILMDDLFPIDLKNIETPKKVGIPREEADKKVLEAITKEPEVMFALQEPETTPLIEEGFSFRELSLEETTPQMEPIFQETLEELPTEEVVFAYQEAPVVEEKKKLLVFSFDNSLIEVLKEQLLEDYEFIVVSTPKEVKERAKDADVLVFDTVSGMIAQKLLTELSKDETLAKKPYVILIDELFAIDVASIPIENKFSYARESELGQAINKVK
ncbi:MAG: DNA-binding response regulator, partial [Aquificota bacterium]